MINESNTIIAGDTLELDLLFDGYTPTDEDGWLVWVALRGNQRSIDIKDGETGVTIVTTTGRYVITVTPAATSAYVAGDYKYAIYMYKQVITGDPGEEVTTITDRFLVDEGTCVIKPDLSAMTDTSDARSHVKIVLDAIEAVIANRATVDQMSYTIAGRSLGRMPIGDLLMLRDRYRAEYAGELQAEKIAQGMGGNPRVVVRFR